MELPNRILHKKLNESELIELLAHLEKQKAKAIKDQQYQYAQELSEKEQKYRVELEDLMSPKLKAPKVTHLIGLGAAGSTMLLQFYKEKPQLKYTIVTNPTHESLPEAILFINSKQQNRSKLLSRENPLPEELINRIKLDEHIIIFTGLGGTSGTILTDQLIQFCINSTISFQVACSWPLPFEGGKRFLLAEEFLSNYASLPNVYIAKEEISTIYKNFSGEAELIRDLFQQITTVIIQKVLLKINE